MAAVSGYQPPPFFRRGLPPSAKLTLYLAICLTLLIGDLQMRYLDTLRQGVAILTYPLQIAAATPAEFTRNVSNYFNGLITLQRENERLRTAQLKASKELLRDSQLEAENEQLRGLLAIRERVKVSSIAAEILFTARDPFSRKVILDKGGNAGIESGLAVVDAEGVIGQVTRVFPLHAEVTLLSDKEQAIPVLIERSGLRAVMFGTGSGLMELRYLAANADVRVGDRIVTSGLDGVFVKGLPVATVIRASRDAAESFGRILCLPIGGVEKSGAVLVLGRAGGVPGRPPEVYDDPRRTLAGRVGRRDDSSSSAASSAASGASSSEASAASSVNASSAASATAASSARASSAASSAVASKAASSAASSAAAASRASSSRVASSASSAASSNAASSRAVPPPAPASAPAAPTAANTAQRERP
ncbi:rod shape-determining protein MreC [Viridibacterium curvum]|uniref:Cell shape-determining protein MreC n=1 Tax=Viridibacterium curvum TaxID=1101404 RepID=A0ABP9QPL3_9RHOO